MGAYVTTNPTPSGDITGSGTAGYLAMFTSANVIGDSTINQSSGNTGVGMPASANAGFAITTTAATSGTKTGFYFLQTGNTGQAASTEANGVLWSMGTRQWATGSITDQREFYIGSCAYSFVAASTITNAYGLYAEAPTAGTNATITNPYAAGFSGYVNIIADSSSIKIRSLVGTPGTAAIYFNQTTPSASNYSIFGTTILTAINADTTTGTVAIRVNNSTVINQDYNSVIFQPVAKASLVTSFTFTVPANTGQTASTESANFRVSGNAKTWAAGAITTQRWNYFTANTAAFASASTITNSYGLYVEAATAGTNATITNNYAIGTNGDIDLTGGNRIVRSSGGSIRIDCASGSTVRLDISGTASLTASSTQITLRDPMDFVLGTTTGTKFGTATTQKLAFWNKTPIVQPTTGITGAARVGGGGAAVTDTDTFGGYTIAQLAAVIINTGLAA